jgi:hypothetical protein
VNNLTGAASYCTAFEHPQGTYDMSCQKALELR